MSDSPHSGGLEPRGSNQTHAGSLDVSRARPDSVKEGGGTGARRPRAVREPKVRANDMEPQFWLPDWVRAHVDRGSSPRDVVAEALERVSESPHEEALLEAQAIVNELARHPDNAPLVHEAIRHVDRLLARQAGE